MSLTTVEWLHSTAYWIYHPNRPCTDKRARRIIRDARINALTIPDNEQD